MSGFVTWSKGEPPAVVYLVQWDHIEGERGGKPDVRRMHVWCDEESLKGEIQHLARRKVKFKVWRFDRDGWFDGLLKGCG